MRLELFGLVVVLAALLACAHAEATNVGPGLYSIECNKARRVCYEKAAELCPSGFQVVDGSERSGTYATANTYGNQTTVTAVPIYKGEVLVRCNVSGGTDGGSPK